MDDKPNTVEQDLEQVAEALCLVARQIGNIAGCNCHYTYGLARRIQQTGRGVEDLTIGELLQIDREYTEIYNRIHGDYARPPAHVREADTENFGGVRKQVTEVTSEEKQAERQ